jgi:hypothetical protein
MYRIRTNIYHVVGHKVAIQDPDRKPRNLLHERRKLHYSTR